MKTSTRRLGYSVLAATLFLPMAASADPDEAQSGGQAPEQQSEKALDRANSQWKEGATRGQERAAEVKRKRDQAVDSAKGSVDDAAKSATDAAESATSKVGDAAKGVSERQKRGEEAAKRAKERKEKRGRSAKDAAKAGNSAVDAAKELGGMDAASGGDAPQAE